MKNIILKIIYHCKNDWFFRLWMSFYLNLLCMERKMMMLSKYLLDLYQSKIDLQPWWDTCSCKTSQFTKILHFPTRTTTYVLTRMLSRRHWHSDLLKQSRVLWMFENTELLLIHEWDLLLFYMEATALRLHSCDVLRKFVIIFITHQFLSTKTLFEFIVACCALLAGNNAINIILRLFGQKILEGT